MTPLRQQMIRELELHRKSPKTIEAYVCAVAQLAEYHRRSPETISVAEVRDFLHHLITVRQLAFSSVNQKAGGIRFFYQHVLGREEFQLKVPMKRSGRLPQPLGRTEISRLFDAARNPKHRVILMTAYAAGLRVSELAQLKLDDIHSDRMLIRVDQGKGRKDRYTLLSPRLLEELRDYWRAYRPRPWLFLNKDGSRHLPPCTAQKIYDLCKLRAGITRDGSRWIAGGGKFLFPVHGLSKMFRARYLAGLKTLLDEDRIDLPPHLEDLRDPASRRRLLKTLYGKPWVVYSQRPFAGPQKLLEYLGRYTHRAAISNHRLLSCDNGQVRFTYRDRRDGDRQKTAALPADQFLQRFVRHVLPPRFQRIRHYGLLANRGKHERLALCRQLLGGRPEPDRAPPASSLAEWLISHLEIDPDVCPCCGERLLQERLVPPSEQFSTSVTFWDTS